MRAEVPSVIVQPGKEGYGADTLDAVQAGEVSVRRAIPFLEAFDRRWETHAHVALYQVSEPGGRGPASRWPRLNKPILPELREAGVEVTLSLSMQEWDSPGHRPMTRRAYEVSVQAFREALRRDPPLPEPFRIYRTRAGGRAVWVHPALTPEQHEAFNRWLLDEVCRRGFPLDVECHPTWNHLFALPWTRRDGEDLDPEPIYEGPITEELPEHEDPGYELSAALDSAVLRAGQPDPAQAQKLIWQVSGRLTPWGRAAKKLVGNRDSALTFDRQDPPQVPEGRSRNETLFAWAAQLVGILGPSDTSPGLDGTTPEHVFGLLVPTALVNSKADGRDLVHETWRATCYCWARQEGKGRAVERAAETFTGSLRRGVESWWPGAPEDDGELASALRKQAVLVHGNDYYVLRSDGLYAEHPVKQAALVAALRHSGVVGQGKLIAALESEGKAMGTQRAVDVFGRPISVVELVGGRPIGGYYRAESNLLVVSRFTRRDDLPAEFSEAAAEWLEAFFTPKHYLLGQQWVAAFQALDAGHLAALHVLGRHSMGKDMFALGLSETLTSQTYAGKEVFDRWQYFIDRTPFVWVNETHPPSTSAFDVRLREMIGSNSLTIEQKHAGLVRVSTPFRVLLTGNTEALVSRLFSRKGMSDDEREATRLRVIHLDLRGSKAPELLEERGAWKHTKGWVRGTGQAAGEPSREVLARHFRWIYENVPLPPPGRFLIDGNRGDGVRGFAFEDPEVADVGEQLLGMRARGLLEGGKVSAKEVVDYMDSQLLGGARRGHNLVSVGRGLSAFCLPGTKGRSGRRTLDMKRLDAFARRVGGSATKVEVVG